MSSRNAVETPRIPKPIRIKPIPGEGRKLLLAILDMRGWVDGETEAGYPHITEEHYRILANDLSATTTPDWPKDWGWTGVRNVVKYPPTFPPSWRMVLAAWDVYSMEWKKNPNRKRMSQPAAIHVVQKGPGWQKRQEYIYSLTVPEREHLLLSSLEHVQHDLMYIEDPPPNREEPEPVADLSDLPPERNY